MVYRQTHPKRNTWAE